MKKEERHWLAHCCCWTMRRPLVCRLRLQCRPRWMRPCIPLRPDRAERSSRSAVWSVSIRSVATDDTNDRSLSCVSGEQWCGQHAARRSSFDCAIATCDTGKGARCSSLRFSLCSLPLMC